MWDHIPSDLSRMLIENMTRGNAGLAPKKWMAQLEAIRALPEVKR